MQDLDEIEDDDSISLDDALDELDIDYKSSEEAEADVIDEGILNSLEDALSDENFDLDDLVEEKSTEDLINEETTETPEEVPQEAEDLIREDRAAEVQDEIDEDLSKLLSEAEEEDFDEDLEDLISEEPSDLFLDEEEDSTKIGLDEILAEDISDDNLLDEDLDDLISEDEDDLIIEDEDLNTLSEVDDSELDALLEKIAEEDDEDELALSDEKTLTEEMSDDEVDLDALNDEIKEALDGLDEDDLQGELEDLDAIAETDEMEDIFSSLNSNDLKLALGEEVEETDEEEAKIQEEIEALESTLDEDEDLEFSVGQSEFASLNEEALYEAMGEDFEGDNEHPELDEVDAFVDAVSIEGETGGLSQTGTNENIVALEELIATLKQDNVREALKGMKMNISISFSETSE